MKRLINILDIIGDESCLSVAKHELLLDNAPELSAFPVEYEMHYLDGVPDSVTPEPVLIAIECIKAIEKTVQYENFEILDVYTTITADAIAYEEKNWTELFADDTFEKSWLEDDNDNN